MNENEIRELLKSWHKFQELAISTVAARVNIGNRIRDEDRLPPNSDAQVAVDLERITVTWTDPGKGYTSSGANHESVPLELLWSNWSESFIVQEKTALNQKRVAESKAQRSKVLKKLNELRAELSDLNLTIDGAS